MPTFDFTIHTAPDTKTVTEALQTVLPGDGFIVFARNYGGGDARSMHETRAAGGYKIIITVNKTGRLPWRIRSSSKRWDLRSRRVAM